MVDRLEERGMVTRQVDDQDRRITRITPSKAVDDFVREKLPQLEVHPLVEALRRARPHERELVVEGIKVLRRLTEATRSPRHGAPKQSAPQSAVK
jgi:DNA-binding MarR family transcriptional regulator